MTNDSADLAALTSDVFPDECLLIGDEPLAALAEKLQTVHAPHEALLTVDGGDDLDLAGTFEFLANAMTIIIALRMVPITRDARPEDIQTFFLDDPVRHKAAQSLTLRDLLRIRDRLAR